MKNVSRREQMCYEIRLADYGEDTVFHIVCCNFKVLVEGPEPFEDEVPAPPVVVAPGLAQLDGGNVVIEENFVQENVGNHVLEIGELTADGIVVDNEGPAPENAVPQPQGQGIVGEWEKQLVCIRRSNTAIADTLGKWKGKTWPQVGEMTEFAIFRMTFPEDYLKNVVIPATNAHIEGDALTLSELYVWLGCRFFMACFVGDFELRAWWSKKAVSLWEGAPHRLNDFIELDRFREISRSYD